MFSIIHESGRVAKNGEGLETPIMLKMGFTLAESSCKLTPSTSSSQSFQDEVAAVKDKTAVTVDRKIFT